MLIVMPFNGVNFNASVFQKSFLVVLRDPISSSTAAKLV